MRREGLGGAGEVRPEEVTGLMRAAVGVDVNEDLRLVGFRGGVGLAPSAAAAAAAAAVAAVAAAS